MGRILKQLSTSQIIVLGFAAVILLGSLLLVLPVSAADGRGGHGTDRHRRHWISRLGRYQDQQASI